MTVRVPPVFNHVEAIAFWIAYVWAFSPEFALIRKAKLSSGGAQDRGTMRMIVVANQLAMLIAFVASFLPWFALPEERLMLIVGTLSLVAGSLLRRWCFRLLGAHFTGAVTATSDQPVIERGPYRLLRHPSYTGGLLMFGGIGIALANGLSIAALIVLPFLAYLMRMSAEERALTETIGEPYRQYMSRTKRLLPFVY